MTTTVLSSLDLTKNQIQNPKFHVLASDPGGLGGGDEGLFWYNSTSKKFMYWNGTTAIDVTARVNHTGAQTASTISDFNTAVQANRLDQLAAPTTAVSMGSQIITNVATPVSNSDAATKSYVDAAIAGLAWKDTVRVATTAAGTLATSFANGQTVDGVVLATGNRLLLKNQAAGAENGIYTVNATGAPTRSTDADTAAEVQGAAVFVESGTVNGGTAWVMNTSGAITLGTTALSFVQFGSGGGGGFSVAGNGLTSTGAQVDVVGGTGITVAADSVSIDTAVVARKVTGLIGNGAATAITFNHALGNQHVHTQVFRVSDNALVIVDTVNTDANNVTVTFATAPASNAFRVVVIG